MRSGLKKVLSAPEAIVYKHFLPTGRAVLSFTRPEFVPAAVKALDKAFLGGKPLSANASDNPVAQRQRTRGVKGSLEAAQRGIIAGNGPDGGVTGGSKNVVLYGLPGKMTADSLAWNLRNFQLAGSERGKPVVIKIERG